MSKGVVIHFEAVNIKHTDGKRKAQSDCFAPFRGAVPFIPAPVGNPRQLVGHRLLLNLPAITVQLDMRVDPCLDNQGFKGLSDIVDRTQNETALLVCHAGQAGNQNDRDALRNDLFLQFLQQRKPVHPRHDHVQQNERKAPIACPAQSIFRPLSNGNIILVLQNGL